MSDDLFDPHPLFPRDDDKPEDRDIKFVSFKRQDPKGAITVQCEEIPASEVTSWKQVFEWWGGGRYKAIGKNGAHRFQAHYPPGGEWFVMEGPSRPFFPRDHVSEVAAPEVNAAPVAAAAPAVAAALVAVASPAVAAAPAVAAPAAQAAVAVAPPAAAPSATEVLLVEVLRELRDARAQPQRPAQDPAVLELARELRELRAQTQRPAQDPAVLELAREMRELRTERNHAPDNTVQVAMINANAALMTTMLTALGGRDDGLEKMVSLATALKQLAPAPAAPVAAPGLAEQIPLLKALRELATPAAAPAAENELKTIVDGFTGLMAAEAQQKTAEAARATVSKPAEVAPRSPSRPRGDVVHVLGVGVCEVLARDVAPSTPPHSAAVPAPPAAPSPAAVIGTPAAATAAVPPTPAAVVGAAAAPPTPAIVDSPPLMASPAVVAQEPQAVSDIVVSPLPAVAPPVASAPPAVAAPPPDPPTVAATPLAEVLAPATPTIEAPEATAPFARAPPVEGRAPEMSVAEAERAAAARSLQAIGRLARPERVALLQKIPGVGAMAEEVADAVADLPEEAAEVLIRRIGGDDVGFLARMDGKTKS